MNNNPDEMDNAEAEDLIDLGREVGPGMPEMTGPGGQPAEPPKVNYPTIMLTLDQPIDFPAGEFSFVGVGSVGKEGVDHKTTDGKYTYDLEVRAIKPVDSVEEAEEEAAEETAKLPQVDSAAILEDRLFNQKKKGIA